MLRWVLVGATLAGCRIGFTPYDTSGDGGVDSPPPIMHTLRFDRVAPTMPLLDVPVLVVLDDTRAQRTMLAADASDLRFFDSDGNVLAHEIERPGIAGGEPLVAWVRVPSIVGLQTTITMTYGATPGATSVEGVWTNGHAAVWHLSGDGPSWPDSAGNHDLTAVGTRDVAGRIGRARVFDRALDEYMVAPSLVTFLPTEFTLSVWASLATLPGMTGYYAAISRPYATSSTNEMFISLYGDTAGTTVLCETYPGTQRFGVGGTLTANTWTHLAFTANATELRVYMDGIEVATNTVGAPLLASANPILLGADNNGTVASGLADTDFLDGMLDEARILDRAQPAGYIAYDHAVQRDLVISYP